MDDLPKRGSTGITQGDKIFLIKLFIKNRKLILGSGKIN